VVEASRTGEGFMTLEDLEFYRPGIAEPLKGEFAGYEALTIPPPSSGGAALIEALNLFDLTGVTSLSHGSPESIHLMSQCLQQAYADAGALVGDPSFVSTDWSRMLTGDYAELASEGIAPDSRPGPRIPLQAPAEDDTGNTSHLVVVDSRGNVVSLTQSINYFFGAGVMAGQTGLLLNNQMADFSLPPDTVNLIEGRKRPRSNMTPVIMLKDGRPVLVVGTPGGTRIVAATAQIITDVVCYRLDISTAIDYPRFFPVRDNLVLEDRYPLETLKTLKKTGYKIYLAGPYHTYFGGAHGIVLPPLTDRLSGAADKRRGGAARGY